MQNLRRIVKSLESSTKAKQELKQALAQAKQMLKSAEDTLEKTALALGTTVDELTGSDKATGEDMITIKDKDGKEVVKALTDPAVIKWVIETSDRPEIRDSPTGLAEGIHEAGSKKRLLKAVERLGDLGYKVDLAKAAYLAGPAQRDTFLKLFKEIAPRFSLSQETGLIEGPALIGGIHSSSTGGLRFLELLIMIADDERKKTADTERFVEVGLNRYPLSQGPVIVRSPEDANLDTPLSFTMPAFAVAQIERQTTVGFEDYLSGPDIVKVTPTTPISIPKDDEATLQLELQSDKEPSQYIALVALPTTVSLNRTEPSLMHSYGKGLIKGMRSVGGSQTRIFSVPFGSLHKLEIIVNGSLPGTSKGLALIRHISNPSLVKTVALPEITVTKGTTTTTPTTPKIPGIPSKAKL
ncbi:MAG: hypothetical protein HY878_04620, partial [Deltaproteobacteria bacterium]|nr:hypothetical protein [Deltaproteobacteria bacterium]